MMKKTAQTALSPNEEAAIRRQNEIASIVRAVTRNIRQDYIRKIRETNPFWAVCEFRKIDPLEARILDVRIATRVFATNPNKKQKFIGKWGPAISEGLLSKGKDKKLLNLAIELDTPEMVPKDVALGVYSDNFSNKHFLGAYKTARQFQLGQDKEKQALYALSLLQIGKLMFNEAKKTLKAFNEGEQKEIVVDAAARLLLDGRDGDAHAVLSYFGHSNNEFSEAVEKAGEMKKPASPRVSSVGKPVFSTKQRESAEPYSPPRPAPKARSQVKTELFNSIISLSRGSPILLANVPARAKKAGLGKKATQQVIERAYLELVEGYPMRAARVARALLPEKLSDALRASLLYMADNAHGNLGKFKNTYFAEFGITRQMAIELFGAGEQVQMVIDALRLE